MGVRRFIVTKSVGLYINLLSYVRPNKAAGLAYRLFSEPREGRLHVNSLPKILQSAQRGHIHDNGRDFHSYIWKGGPDISLLVHGWESNASRWEKMLPHLIGAGHTVIAIDGPAHGLSPGREFNVPEYASVIEAAVKKFRPHYLIGHSMGGAACIYHHYKYGCDGLRKMILLGAPSDLRTLIGNYVNLLGLSGRMVGLLEEYFNNKFAFKFDEFSGGLFAQKFNLSGVIAHDLEDTVVAFEESRKIAGSWRGATFIETRGLGHSMHDEELYRRLISHLQE